MSNSNTSASFLVELTEPQDKAPIKAPMNTFLAFSAKMAFELENLEQRWKHLSAPAARRSFRNESR